MSLLNTIDYTGIPRRYGGYVPSSCHEWQGVRISEGLLVTEMELIELGELEELLPKTDYLVTSTVSEPLCLRSGPVMFEQLTFYCTTNIVELG